MQIASAPDTTDHLPPPPYTTEDPVGGTSSSLPIRTTPSEDPSSVTPESRTALSHIQYTIFFDSDTAPNNIPFPSPADEFLNREVSAQDWATFVDLLFHSNDDNTDIKGNGKPKKKPSPQSTFDSLERKSRIFGVVTEWNHVFFGPRNIHIVTNLDPLPESSRSADETPELSNTTGHSFWHRKLHRSDSHSSLASTSSSSSSNSSLSSISTKDLKYASIPAIFTLISAFRQDLLNQHSNLRQTVKSFRTQLRSQHLASSSSDPTNKSPATFSKEDKRNFKNQRKAAKKEIKNVIKEAKHQHKAFRKEHHREFRADKRELKKEWKRCKRESRHSHCRKHRGRGARDVVSVPESKEQQEQQGQGVTPVSRSVSGEKA